MSIDREIKKTGEEISTMKVKLAKQFKPKCKIKTIKNNNSLINISR